MLPSAPGLFDTLSSVFSRFVFAIFCYVNNSTSSTRVSTATINQTLMFTICTLVLYLIYIIFHGMPHMLLFLLEQYIPPEEVQKKKRKGGICLSDADLCRHCARCPSLSEFTCACVLLFLHKRLCFLGVLHPFQLFHVLPSPRVS